MRWRGGPKSENVEDRRGAAGPRLAVGGGGLAILVVIVALLFGADPRSVMKLLQGVQPPAQAPAASGQDDEMKEFVSVVLGTTEEVWTNLFRSRNMEYEKPRLVLFTGSVKSGCGFASAQMGPFYCPVDKTVYIDLSFYRDLKERHKAPGDFAQAYVIAHEVGHHVQNLMGRSDQVHAARSRLDEEQYNKLSVRLELQADYYAGVWAHHAERMRSILEEGDIEEGLTAASAIGDDRLQRESQGYVVPEKFTHGTSAQRVKWFREGLRRGDWSYGEVLFDLSVAP